RVSSDSSRWWGGWSNLNFNSASMVWSSATYTVGPGAIASTGTWSYILPSGKLQDNTSYFIMVKARDIAGNIQTDGFNSSTFTVDVTSPTSASTFPTGNPQTVATITGTAADTPPGDIDPAAGAIQLRIYEVNTTKIFNGNSFVV